MAYDVISRSQGYVWDVNLLMWVKAQQSIIATDTLTIDASGLLTDAELRASPVPVDLADLTTAMEFDGDNPIYIGMASPGGSKSAAVWQIRKVTFSGANPTDIQFPNGSDDFNQVWNDRASLSYS